MTLRVLDLFSGIGGFSLGLERAGMRTVAFCEIEEYPRAVLRKHWPDVPVFTDVRLLTRQLLEMLDIEVDVICGGFPCQDISLAGKGAGLAGERSGLWFEYSRLLEEIRPQWAIIENVSALRSRGLDTVLGSLAAIGYDAEWHCIPASAVGAPHRRDRIWIVAYPNGQRQQGRAQPDIRAQQPGLEASLGDDALRLRSVVADADGTGLEIRLEGASGERETAVGGSRWATEPDVGRVAHGVPARVDRLKCLGNSVVPQIPEAIGRAILATQQRLSGCDSSTR